MLQHYLLFLHFYFFSFGRTLITVVQTISSHRIQTNEDRDTAVPCSDHKHSQPFFSLVTDTLSVLFSPSSALFPGRVQGHVQPQSYLFVRSVSAVYFACFRNRRVRYLLDDGPPHEHFVSEFVDRHADGRNIRIRYVVQSRN